MAKPLKPTAAELDLLRILWRLGPATVKEAHAELLKDREVAYSAVLRLMQIMHGKGLLLRDEAQRSHVYRPAQAQDSTQTGLLGDLIRKAFAGSGKALVLAALKGGHVTPEERREIEGWLRGEGGGK
ncbi:BlaI/MecI/CopY family transcriptional regulator [Geothrix sp. 21YS21S-2]|uniref:BlaI/MecI/CopY family transcriptional regulator n=1 Tax=Geothrix sp. 21YS21S-2 TaxID=3068893 RepID=UPI0027B8E72E|nr:BlaI/MecI/CopY family transcriptional regulator [Geothrix sp. 21YS21S-2]